MSKNTEIGLAKQEFERILTIVNSKKDKNITIEEFWNQSSNIVNDEAYGLGAYGSFDSQIRWHFKNGKIIQESIKNYLVAKSKENYHSDYFSKKKTKVEIDFTDWNYTIEEKNYTIRDFGQYSRVRDDEDNYKYLIDFSGIDLSGIQLENCIIKNCYLVSAFFDNSKLENVEFNSCMLDSSSFYKANLNTVNFTNNTTIRGVLFDGAWLENLKNLNNDSVPTTFYYTEVKYWWIVKILLKSAFGKKRIEISDLKNQSHTTFNDNNLENLTLPHFKSQIDYINWFQSLLHKLFYFKSLKPVSKLSFFFSVIATKYWSSFTALGISALIINLFYTIIYFLNNSSYYNLFQKTCPETFIKSFYFSTVTFMTLGYGDVYPVTSCGQLIVITEVTLGYIVLGLFVYLVSRKVDKLY